jgi:hypothetical protein
VVVAAVTGTVRAAWEAIVATAESRDDLADAGRLLLAGLDTAAAALADTYADADAERAAGHAEERRAVIDELLGGPPQDRRDALRRRRLAERRGMGGDRAYRLTVVSAGLGATEPAVDAMIDGLRRGLGAPRPVRRDAFALPEVAAWRGRAVIIDTAGEADELVVRGAFTRASRGAGAVAWVAIAGPSVAGVDGLAASMERLREAVRTAERVGRTGWIRSIDALDLEILLTLDDDLRRKAIEAELGPLLEDRRNGPALIETLEAYLASGHNAREVGRRLHIAPRTVAYRLHRIEQALARPLDSPHSIRLGVALFAHRLDPGTRRGDRAEAANDHRIGAGSDAAGRRRGPGVLPRAAGDRPAPG